MEQVDLKEEITLKELVMKIKEWFLYIVSKWKIILLFCSFGFLVGYFYSINKSDIYVAELTFIVENDKPMVLGGSLASTLGFDLGGSNNDGIFSSINMIELFKSRRMVEKTLLTTVPFNNKIISLADMYQMIDNSKTKSLNADNIIFPINKKRQEFSRLQDSILGTIYNHIKNDYLKIELHDKESSIIKVEMKYKNELFAKYFIDALSKVVSDDYNEMKTQKSKNNTRVLQHQTDSVRIQLNNAINGVENVSQDINFQKVIAKKQQVDIEINTKVLTELIKQLELSKVTVRKDAALIQVIDYPILPLPKEVFGKTKGIVLGGLFAGILIIVILIIKKIVNQILNL